jgi:nucleoside 2-deoxyribosyltransferase
VPTAYVASPYGFSEATLGYYAALLDLVRRAGIQPLDPWAGGSSFVEADAVPPGPDRVAAFRAVNHSIAERNLELIRSADVVLAILDGTDVDSGVAAEIGYAAALGKTVLGVRLDTRRTGDNEGSVVNLQVEALLAAPVARSLQAAIADLMRFT